MLRFQSETPGLLSNLADSIIRACKRRLPRYHRVTPAEVREVYRSPVDFSDVPTAPVWWVAYKTEHGSSWLWDEFVIIDVDLPPALALLRRFEKDLFPGGPDPEPTILEAVSGMVHPNIFYLHSLHVFWRNGLPLSGFPEYLTPSLIFTIEIRPLNLQAWQLANTAGDSGRIWPLIRQEFTMPFQCAFFGPGRVNQGLYLGPWNAAAAKRALFRMLRKELQPKGKPQRLGGRYDAFGHPATGWPPFEEVWKGNPFLAPARIPTDASEIH